MTATRLISALLALAVVSSATLLWLDAGSDTAPRGLAPDVPADANDRPDAAPRASLGAPGSPAGAARSALGLRDADVAEPARAWTGVVRVGDEPARLSDFEGDGVMVLARREGGISVLRILEGRWDATALGDGPVEVRELWLSGRSAQALGPVGDASAAGSTLAALWAGEIEFLVTDTGGVPLRGVDVLRQEDDPGRLWILPWLDPEQQAEPLLAAVASPVRVPIDADASACLWFTAPGYGWSRWRPGPGERSVALEVESRLRVEADLGELGTDGWRVSLHAAHGYPGADACATRELGETLAIEFGKLPAGDYVVALERAASGGRTVCEARASLEVGRTGTLVLSPTDASGSALERSSAEVRGFVTCSEPGQVASLRIHPWSREPLARGQRMVDVGDSIVPCAGSAEACLEWGPAQLVPGKYLVQALPANASWVIDVQPGPNVDDHDLPRAHAVRFDFLDSVRGVPVETSRVSLTQLAGAPTDVLRFPKATSLALTPVAASVVAEVFPGPLGLTVDAPGYGLSYLTLEPEALASTQVVELTPKAELILRCEGYSPLVTHAWLRAASVVDAASGRRVAHESLGVRVTPGPASTTSARLAVAHGGDYVVHLPALGDDERHVLAPVQVALESGRVTTLPVDAPWSGTEMPATVVRLEK
jgi:hypothetical protein